MSAVFFARIILSETEVRLAASARLWALLVSALLSTPSQLTFRPQKGGCHGDCTRFGGSRSAIPNKSFTHSVSFPFLLPTQRTLQWKEFSDTDGDSCFCTSAGAWKPSHTQQRSSHLCWFPEVLTHAELKVADPHFSIFLKLAARVLLFLPLSCIQQLQQYVAFIAAAAVPVSVLVLFADRSQVKYTILEESSSEATSW